MWNSSWRHKWNDIKVEKEAKGGGGAQIRIGKGGNKGCWSDDPKHCSSKKVVKNKKGNRKWREERKRAPYELCKNVQPH